MTYVPLQHDAARLGGPRRLKVKVQQLANQRGQAVPGLFGTVVMTKQFNGGRGIKNDHATSRSARRFCGSFAAVWPYLSTRKLFTQFFWTRGRYCAA